MAKICTLANIGCYYCRDGLCRYGRMATISGPDAAGYLDCAHNNSIDSKNCGDDTFKEIQVTYMARMLAAVRQNKK